VPLRAAAVLKVGLRGPEIFPEKLEKFRKNFRIFQWDIFQEKNMKNIFFLSFCSNRLYFIR